jgi:hypothetical protein
MLLAFLIGFFPFFSIGATNVVLVAFLSLWVFDLLKKKTRFVSHRTPFDNALLAYFLVWVVASLAGFSPLSSFKKIFFFQRPLLFYLLLFAYRGNLIPSALLGVGIGAFLNIVYGWGQYFLWTWVYDLAGGARPDWLLMIPKKWQAYLTLSPGQGRIHGAFHLMTYSELLLPPLLFFGARYLEPKKALRYLAGCLMAGGALVLTAARGPFLGAMAGFALMIYLHPRRIRLLLPVSVILILVKFNPVFQAKMGVIPVRLPEAGEMSVTLETESEWSPPVLSTGANKESAFFHREMNFIHREHRLKLWKGGLYIGLRHWWLGVGPGQIGPVTKIYNKNADFPPNPQGQEKDLHSFYIQRFVEMGLPGLVVSIWVMVVFFRVGREFYCQREKISAQFPALDPVIVHSLSLGLWASFLAYGVINLTERAFDDAEVSVVFWILAATTVWFARHTTKLKERVS